MGLALAALNSGAMMLVSKDGSPNPGLDGDPTAATEGRGASVHVAGASFTESSPLLSPSVRPQNRAWVYLTLPWPVHFICPPFVKVG